MKKISALILALVVLGSGIFFASVSSQSEAQTAAQSAEREAVKIPLNNYLQAHATGKAEFVRKAFHPDAKLFWYRDGKMMTRTAEEFAAGFSGTPAPDEAQRKRNIDTIDISGNAAIARILVFIALFYVIPAKAGISFASDGGEEKRDLGFLRDDVKKKLSRCCEARSRSR